jgi:GNAT superfamily N-acetyltransferase
MSVTQRALDVRCAPMTAASRSEAFALLGAFLGDDPHYRANAAGYGDGGKPALSRALDLFLARPELGFVWLARVGDEAVGACVVSNAISTARGSVVGKLDDVTIDERWHGRGVGTAMLEALATHLRQSGATRIDTSCHRDNKDAWRFYARLGFTPLDEERLALLL